MKSSVFFSLVCFIGLVFAAPSKGELKALFNTDTDTLSEMRADNAYIAARTSAKTSADLIGFCNGRYYNGLMNDFSSRAKRGDPTASMKAFHAVQVAASCATVEIKKQGDTDFARYSSMAGIALASGLLADGVKSRTPNVERAIAYLEFAEQSGKGDEVRETLARLKSEAMPTSTIDPDKGVVSLTAEAAAAAFNGNRLAFKKKWGKKPMAVTGRLFRVGGNEREVELHLLGTSKKAREDLTTNDFIACRVTDQKSKDKALEASAGKNITVKGIYVSGRTLPGQDQIVLLDCKI